MGITHGYSTDFHRRAAHRQGITWCTNRCLKGDFLRLQARVTHIDGHLAVLVHDELYTPGFGMHRNPARFGQTLVVDETCKTAGPIAALLYLAAIGIEDSVAEFAIDLLRSLDEQQLVAADAKTAVREVANLMCGQLDVLVDRIDDNKVIT